MFQKIIAYCKDSYDELSHKTTWPTRQELTHSAIVVLTASIIIAIVVYLMDTLFEWVMQLIYPHL
ncbi:MAG: preprotein translocase subunit SecE [Prevotellamassilia sp.]|uniref:preprotein translocase subunit SecE n=1 Tax=Alloprevotella sp. TaxID=1872471 RepID=UPI0015B055F0|nr:preprotein translocase subunit SecE [Prevotellamassilia sp.]